MSEHSKNCTLWILINPQGQAAKNAVQTDSDPQLLCIRNKNPEITLLLRMDITSDLCTYKFLLTFLPENEPVERFPA
jgi:hypothetical protein